MAFIVGVFDLLTNFSLEQENKELGAKTLATILSHLQKNELTDALALTQGLVNLDIAYLTSPARSPFIKKWDLWARDPEFLKMLAKELSDRKVILDKNNSDLMALVLTQIGFSPKDVEHIIPTQYQQSPRICNFIGEEPASVVIAALMRSGLHHPTEIWGDAKGDAKTEKHYQAIVDSLKKIHGELNITVRTFSDSTSRGLTGNQFDPDPH